MSFVSDNSELLKSMFERTLFTAWKKGDPNDPYGRLELIVTADCNLRCRYCYMFRYGDKLCPPSANNRDDIREHTKMICDWTIENGYRPSVELFSGSPLSQDICLEVLDIIYDKFKDQPEDKKWLHIIIPTNMSFLLNDDLTERVKDLYDRFMDIKMPILLSASLEGKYMEDNRPFKFNQNIPGLFLPPGPDDPRDDAYYDKTMEFIRDYNCGTHPMIYSRKIEDWKKNFLWYQEMFEKHGISWQNMYLLEVRNIEWTDEQLLELCDFIRFLINWTFEKCGKDKQRFIDYVFRHGFNILRSPFCTTARGLTCSIQTCLFVRLGDLKIVPCHRLAYDGYEYGRFIVKDGKIVDIEAKNVEMAIGVHSYAGTNAPQCQDCLINTTCPRQCLGSCLESIGDPFTQIPTVCKMMHMKYYTIIDEFKKLGVYELACNRAGKETTWMLNKLYELGGKQDG